MLDTGFRNSSHGGKLCLEFAFAYSTSIKTIK